MVEPRPVTYTGTVRTHGRVSLAHGPWTVEPTSCQLSVHHTGFRSLCCLTS